MEYFVYVFALDYFLIDELILLIEFLYIFQIIFQIVVINSLINIFGFVILLKWSLNFHIPDFNFFLHVFRDGMFKSAQLHIYFDDLLIGQVQNFSWQKFFSRQVIIKQTIQVRIHYYLLLPILHWLLLKNIHQN